MNERSRKKYYVTYTLVWAVVMLFVMGNFIVKGKTFVALNDCGLQHYPFMIKVREFYRSLLFGFFTGDIPKLVDFNNYFGMDTIASLNYYGLGNPIFLITVLMPKSFMPHAYSIIFLIKIYLSGVCFSEFCFYKKREGLGVLIAAIIYVLGPFLKVSMEQLCFADILYQFPLLLIGIDKIINKKKSKTFILAVMLTALNGYYFLYMATIMLAVYSVIVIWGKTEGIKNFLKECFNILLLTAYRYIVGIMLAAPFFIPNIIVFFQGYRAEKIKLNGFKLFFEKNYYLDEIVNLFIYKNTKCLAINLGAAIAVLFLLVYCKGRYGKYKKLLLISTIATQLHIVGYVMNGFSYASERWIFGYYFFVSYICNIVFSDMLVTLKHKKEKLVFVIVICFCTCIQPLVCFNSYEDIYMSVNELEEFQKGTGGDLVEAGARVDVNEKWESLSEWEGRKDFLADASLFYDVACSEVYQSVIPGNVLNTEVAFDLSDVITTNIICGLDERPELETIFNIKYYITKNEKNVVPYGFEKITEDNKRNILYKNKFQVPYGYTYDSYVKESDLENKNGMERGWQYVSSAGVGDIDTEKINIREKTESTDECEKADCQVVKANNGKYVLKFNKIKNATVYIKCKRNISRGAIGSVKTQNIERQICFKEKSSDWYVPRDYEIFNVGYYDEISKMEIEGVDELEDVEVYYHSMDNYRQQIEKLSEYHLENALMKDNKIKGNIYVPQNRLLCLSTPYIKGWKAYVDGKETEIIKVNGMFMGINLTPGEHSVELKFFTPGLKQGLILWTIGLMFFIGIIRKERVLG